MPTNHGRVRSLMEPVINWGADWAWGVPLIILTVLIHAYFLGLLNKRISIMLIHANRIRGISSASLLVMGTTALWTTALHGFETAIWAASYRLLGALQDNKSAMLYSLGAMTTYGHETMILAPHWRLMGALEALNGWILFGLTTAFLFTVMQRAWPQIEEPFVVPADSQALPQ
jgi:hypothetical protein